MTTPLRRKYPVLTFRTGVNQVPGGGAAGWVSGNPANVSANTSVLCLFDLGADWESYGLVQIGLAPQGGTTYNGLAAASGATAAEASGTTLNGAILLTPAFSNALANLYATVTVANGSVAAFVRPAGRYLSVRFVSDASVACGPQCRIDITAYPT